MVQKFRTPTLFIGAGHKGVESYFKGSLPNFTSKLSKFKTRKSMFK